MGVVKTITDIRPSIPKKTDRPDGINKKIVEYCEYLQFSEPLSGTFVEIPWSSTSQVPERLQVDGHNISRAYSLRTWHRRGGAIIHVIGILGLLRSLRYEETGNFMKLLVIFFFGGSISSIIGDFADWKYLGMPFSFFFRITVQYFICKLGHGM